MIARQLEFAGRDDDYHGQYGHQHRRILVTQNETGSCSERKYPLRVCPGIIAVPSVGEPTNLPSERMLTGLAALGKPRLSIMDETGHLPLDRPGVNFLFQLVGHRYEHDSIILTSNNSYGECGDIFSGGLAAAISEPSSPPLGDHQHPWRVLLLQAKAKDNSLSD